MDVVMKFKEVCEDLQLKEEDKLTAAILVLASAIDDPSFSKGSLGHEICLGIRKGLFGLQADPHKDISHVGDRLVEAVQDHAAILESALGGKNGE